MDESSLWQQRLTLKATLAVDRGVLIQGGWYPLCAYCGRPMKDGFDMHEAILTRGHIRGNSSLQNMIMVRHNCCLVHHGNCHINAATRIGRRKMISYLINWESYPKIIEWLSTIPATSGQVDEATRLVSEVNNEMQSLQKDN